MSLFDLFGGTIVGELRELWVIPGVVTYFMPLGDYPANQFRVSLDVLADQEEGGFEVTRFEQVEEARRVLGAGTIVKRHGQIGALDPRVSINPVGRGGNVGSPWGRFAFLSLGAVARAKERDAKKEKVTHRISLSRQTGFEAPFGPPNSYLVGTVRVQSSAVNPRRRMYRFYSRE